jgi:Rrf2 family transcriptional regulator, iron-sulfur cluster assembly transcription factor
MPLLPRKALLAVAAVIDVAMQDHGQPISAKTLAARHELPPRHLEPVLQALVRCGILKGIRGPRGGYELARDRHRVTANDILRAAGTVEDGEELHGGSELVQRVVLPAMASAEHEFGVALHDLDSFGAIPLESKVARFAGSLAADRPAGWRLRPAEAKGHAGQDPDELVLRAAAPASNWPIGRRDRCDGIVAGRCG